VVCLLHHRVGCRNPSDYVNELGGGSFFNFNSSCLCGLVDDYDHEKYHLKQETSVV